MAKASFYSRLGVTPENSDVTPVEPNSSNAIQDSVNAASISEANAEASKNAAAQHAADANTAKQAAQSTQAAADAAKTNAQSSASAASASSVSAQNSANVASTQASDAAASAADALSQAQISQASAASAATEATNAATSATASETSRVASEAAKVASETAKAAAETAEANSATSAANAAISESNAASSASDAAASAASAAASLASIGNSEVAAAASETAAASSQAAAATSEANASASEAAAAASEAASATSASDSATSAAASAASEAAAATSASDSAASATASAASEAASAASATAAATSETNSATSAAASAASQVAAATSEANSAASEAAAATSATDAATSAADAAASATSASTAKTAAEAARDSALSALDSFDDRYLGVKSADPSLDNDGNPLATGSLYFNDQTNSMLVFDGTSWLSAYASLSGALIQTSNLSDLTDPAAARTNLGLGTAATTASTDYATAAQGAKADAALPTAGGTMTGDIIFAASQLFDGRDVSVDGAKLDGIEAGATADQTKADIDALGINADQVDGLEASQFLRSDAADTMTGRFDNTVGITSRAIDIATTGNRTIQGLASDNTTGSYGDLHLQHYGGDLHTVHGGGTLYANGNTVWHAGNDGSGSGLDADTLDGVQGSSFLRSDANDTFTGTLDAGSSLTAAYRFDGRSFSWNSAMQTPTTHIPHIMQQTYTGWDPVIGIKTTNGFFQFGAYSSDNLHLGYMAGAFGTHSVNGFDQSFTFSGTGNFTASGNVTAYSDERLKDYVTVIENAVEKVSAIRGVTYNRNDMEDAPRHAGVIAQEVEKVLPEVVMTDDNGNKSVAYGNMVGLLIEAIKEQQAQIDELKEKLKV